MAQSVDSVVDPEVWEKTLASSLRPVNSWEAAVAKHGAASRSVVTQIADAIKSKLDGNPANKEVEVTFDDDGIATGLFVKIKPKLDLSGWKNPVTGLWSAKFAALRQEMLKRVKGLALIDISEFAAHEHGQRGDYDCTRFEFAKDDNENADSKTPDMSTARERQLQQQADDERIARKLQEALNKEALNAHVTAAAATTTTAVDSNSILLGDDSSEGWYTSPAAPKRAKRGRGDNEV